MTILYPVISSGTGMIQQYTYNWNSKGCFTDNVKGGPVQPRRNLNRAATIASGALPYFAQRQSFPPEDWREPVYGRSRKCRAEDLTLLTVRVPFRGYETVADKYVQPLPDATWLHVIVRVSNHDVLHRVFLRDRKALGAARPEEPNYETMPSVPLSLRHTRLLDEYGSGMAP